MHSTIYHQAKQLNIQSRFSGYPCLIFMTDKHTASELQVIISRLPAGSMVIFRHYDSLEREAVARAIIPSCRRQNVKMLIARDPLLALRIRADGVHMPEYMVQKIPVWQKKYPHWVVTTSAHSPLALYKASCLGVDAVMVSPVFPTQSHSGAKALGVLRCASLVRCCHVPVYALGGVNKKKIRQLKGSGVAGVAGIRTFY